MILAHLSAVIAPPLAFQSRGPRGLSPSVSLLLSPLAAYGQFLYLDRGYAFFAPDPGPSHLMRVEISSGENNSAEANDANVETRLYPSLDDQWPRLLYHRHFMLAEFLNDAYQPALPGEAAKLVGSDLPIEELKAWRMGRQRYEMIADSMIRHLQKKFDAQDVKIDRLEHMIPDFVPYANEPTPLNDPPTYVLLEDIPITLDTLLGVLPQDLPQPEPRETVPAPSGEPIRDRSATSETTDERERESETTAPIDHQRSVVPPVSEGVSPQ